MKQPWPAQHGTIDYISSPPSTSWQQERRRIVVLGSTGSIGVNALQIIAQRQEDFSVLALAGAKNIQLLAKQAEHFKPPYIAVYGQAEVDVLYKLLKSTYKPHILHGQQGYTELASLHEANTVLSAQVGAAGLRATVAAALEGKVICLANKESLVLAGDIIRHICCKTGASILPVDSEHNALFQMLAGRPHEHIKRLILTASGGPFRGKMREELHFVTRKDALAHPNWSMGSKISIDSATLMNKGLEFIEAYHLYGISPQHIDVVVHPQSVIHSFVEYADNSLLAHMGTPHMGMPIAHCLHWPHVHDCRVQSLDLVRMGTLTFEEADISSFPCLALAKQALAERQCVVLNAANETAVELFLEGRISFLDISALVADALQTQKNSENDNNTEKLPFNSSVEGTLNAAWIQKMLEHIIHTSHITRQHIRALANIQE